MQQFHSLSSGISRPVWSLLVIHLCCRCGCVTAWRAFLFSLSPPVRGWNQRGTRSRVLFCCFLPHSLAAHIFMHVAHTLLSCSCSHISRCVYVCECVCVCVCVAAGCPGRALRGNQLGYLILYYQEGLLLYKDPTWANKITATIPHSQFPVIQLAFSFSLLNGYWQVKGPLKNQPNPKWDFFFF